MRVACRSCRARRYWAFLAHVQLPPVQLMPLASHRFPEPRSKQSAAPWQPHAALVQAKLTCALPAWVGVTVPPILDRAAGCCASPEGAGAAVPVWAVRIVPCCCSALLAGPPSMISAYTAPDPSITNDANSANAYRILMAIPPGATIV